MTNILDLPKMGALNLYTQINPSEHFEFKRECKICDMIFNTSLKKNSKVIEGVFFDNFIYVNLGFWKGGEKKRKRDIKEVNY